MSDTKEGQDLQVDWDTYHRLIERLIILVHLSGAKFDQILCLARGGLRVGDVFSRVLRLPLAILATSSYREQAGRAQGELDIAPFITMTQGTLTGRLLLVDDLVDSGHTLSEVSQHLMRTYPSIESIQSAVIWYKACSSVVPDFYVEKLSTNPWIRQPFEMYDSLTPQDLVEKSAKDLSK
ncbi:phosphoribosyltransferase [Zwartia vadi]|uniref:phosphoribosyltransferase n=1 Tax=Zwartia vadi TaxID=3058168 RepID=UPI0025B2AB2F|nr:phosphoribosyltransferase family protein [Zwartia vadi]MDN3988434.1 phosphoribosyltransferase family protein [Zwartia vadi]